MRADSAISRTGLVSVDVKYSVSATATCASTRPTTTAPNMRQPTLVTRALGVADVHEREHERAEDVRMPAVRKPRLIGAIADLSFSVARTENTPTIDASTPMARHASGKMSADRPQLRADREDRLERGDAEDDRRDERHLVRLEQVGGHAGAVADVVAHVVGDGGRVARVVLGDAGFDLADEVGADVGGLGEDAAADTEEQREQRAAEPEADEDRGCVFWKIMMMTVAPSRPRPTVNMPATPPVRNATFSAAGIEPDFAAAAVRTLPRTARLMPMKPVRPDMKQPRTNASVRYMPDSPNDSASCRRSASPPRST